LTSFEHAFAAGVQVLRHDDQRHDDQVRMSLTPPA
jgi:hypothetical protein